MSLRCRLDKRRKAADQAAYDKLVRDVTRTEREAKGATSFLPNAKLQMSQGIHVCVTMGLGYLLGCAMGRLTSFAGASTVRSQAASASHTCGRGFRVGS